MGVSVLAKDVKNPEGPVSLPDGSWVYTEMDIGSISMLTSEGKRRHIATTGLPNGLAAGADGRIWVAEAKRRALIAVDRNGKVETISTGSASAPFLLPNDLCFGPDGMLYMTDTGILLEDMKKETRPLGAYELPFDGRLYEINPSTGESQVLDRGFKLTNGIAFGPGGVYLYVAETLTGNIYRYRTGQWKRELFGNVMIKPPMEYGRVAGPDGMAFDTEGNLYVAVIAQDITVLGPDGNIARHIALPGDNPTNLAFDVSGRPILMITESSRGELLLMDVPLPGNPLYMGAIR